MKAILVINVPDYFNSITHGVLKPIGTVGKLEIGYGDNDGEIICFKFINVDGMLLKPIPPKRIDVLDDDTWQAGWNDCLKEILGEEE